MKVSDKWGLLESVKDGENKFELAETINFFSGENKILTRGLPEQLIFTLTPHKIIVPQSRVVIRVDDDVIESKAQMVRDSLLEVDGIGKFYYYVTTPITIRRPPKLPRRYQLIEEVGFGAFGRVFKAIHLCESRICALKVANKNSQLEKEVEISKNFFQSSHLVCFHHFFTTSAYDVIDMDYCFGGCLSRLIACNDVIDELQMKVIFFQVLQGLNSLHRHHIAHCDVRPDNILLCDLTTRCQVKLCDFGVACDVTNARTGFFGSFPYSAPEMMKQHPTIARLMTSHKVTWDKGVDIWSWAIAVYYTASKSLPFGSPRDYHGYHLHASQLHHPIFDDVSWSSRSHDVIQIIASVLQVARSKRPTCSELMTSSWFDDDFHKAFRYAY